MNFVLVDEASVSIESATALSLYCSLFILRILEAMKIGVRSLKSSLKTAFES